MNFHYRPIILTLCLALSFVAQAQNLEFPALQNIKQITVPSMGFEKAGESYFSPDGKTLIFQAVPTGEKNYQIYSITIAEGSMPQLISTGLGACTCAFFRPDGKKIIFASSHETPDTPDETSQKPGYQRDTKNYVWEFTPYMNIYQANPDGSELQALTHGSAYSAECAYSADGSHIVLASNRSGDMNLYTMYADGTNLQQRTFTTNVYNGGPFYSPDGTKILYRADPETRHYLQIYYLDLQTGETRQLTANNAINWAPFWHPNGDVIVFTTSLHGHSQYELYLLNIKTNALYRLTNNPGFDGLASFNKDGTQVTWTSKRGPDQTCQIFVADFILPEELLT